VFTDSEMIIAFCSGKHV